MSDGFRLFRQIRDMRKSGRQQVREGEKAGQDVSTLKDVLSDVERAYDWTEGILSGTDEPSDEDD